MSEKTMQRSKIRDRKFAALRALIEGLPDCPEKAQGLERLAEAEALINYAARPARFGSSRFLPSLSD